MSTIAASMILGQVVLRGGEAAPAGEILGVDAAGVLIGPKPGTLLIGWDRVKEVQGDFAAPSAAFLPVADSAWRARTRLERGDPIGAEPLFERLFEQYRGSQGPTASVISEGLMRCRLRRGAHVAAIDPWLAFLATQPASGVAMPVMHPSWASEAGLAPAIDPATGLAPALPPIWLAWPSVESFAKQAPPQAFKDAKTAGLLALYVQAARFEVGGPVMPPPTSLPDSGSQIVREIVMSRLGEADQREAARKALGDRVRATGVGAIAPWLEAWCRAAIGRSLLREDSPEQKKLGVVELLQLPARFSDVHPYLCGVALAEASVALRAGGDVAGADVLARELQERLPYHPALDWPQFRAAAPAKTSANPNRPPVASEPKSGPEAVTK